MNQTPSSLAGAATAVTSNPTSAPSTTQSGGVCHVNEQVHPKWSRLEYTWRLDKFWELRALACVEALEDENGGLIWSQKFGDKERGVWQLKLYPCGDLSAAGRNHVSLFLSLDLKSLEAAKAYAVFGCHLLDEEGNKIRDSGKSHTRQKFAENANSWGWSQFIRVTAEDQSLNRLLGSSEALIVKCDIDVFVGVMASPGRNLALPLTWEDELKRYLNSPTNYNVELIHGERILRASRTVLCARSKWFANKLSSPPSGVGGGKVSPDSNAIDSAKSTDLATERSQTSMLDKSGNADGIAYKSFGALLSDSAPLSPMDSRSIYDNGHKNSEENNVPTLSSNRVDVSHIKIDLVENCVAFMHTDDCPLFSESASLTKILELLQAGVALEISALVQALVRRLAGSCITKANALAIQDVAQRLNLRDLEDHCSTYLLMCVRDTTRQEILRLLVPRS